MSIHSLMIGFQRGLLISSGRMPRERVKWSSVSDRRSDAVQGVNDFGRRKYGGPCPPSGVHRYYFKLYVPDTTLRLPARMLVPLRPRFAQRPLPRRPRVPDRVSAHASGPARGVPGIMAIHTFGKYLDFHPHLHALVADGLFARGGGLPRHARDRSKALGGTCSREMCIVSLIDEEDVIERILRHLGLWQEGVRVHSGIDPPGETTLDPCSTTTFPTTTPNRSCRSPTPETPAAPVRLSHPCSAAPALRAPGRVPQPEKSPCLTSGPTFVTLRP